ncbi:MULTISPECIES: NUDIX domain-containing protein [Pseudomonas fluorescens group]
MSWKFAGCRAPRYWASLVRVFHGAEKYAAQAFSRLFIGNQPSNRLLLFKIQYQAGVLAGMSYWATPSGKLRDGESFEAAAVRELYEETGIEVPLVGRCIAHREFLWQMPDGEHVLALEHYFKVHTCTEQCSCAQWTDREREAVCEVRWCEPPLAS